MPPVTKPRDALAAAVFFVFAAIVTAEGLRLEQGTAARMGPGYLPLRLGVLLGAVSLVLLAKSIDWRSVRAARREVSGLVPRTNAASRFRPGPLLAATSALLVFAVCVETIGLLPASAALVLLSRSLDWRGHGLELAALIGVLCVVVAVVFHYGLGLPIALWPAWTRGAG